MNEVFSNNGDIRNNSFYLNYSIERQYYGNTSRVRFTNIDQWL